MVKHMIIWKLKDEFIGSTERKQAIKEALEGLVGKIDGLVSMKILFDPMEGSAGDVMMDSEFSGKEALSAYQKHPLHVEIANGLVRPAVALRLSFDYEA